jgi:hypothetical protein
MGEPQLRGDQARRDEADVSDVPLALRFLMVMFSMFIMGGSALMFVLGIKMALGFMAIK